MKKIELDKPHYLGHRKRVKDKFLKSDSTHLKDYELLEILLFSTHPRIDTKTLAKKIIEKFGSINELINSDPKLLQESQEFSENLRVLIKIIQEIIKRNFFQKIDKKIIINNWEALLSYCQIQFFNLKHEEFRILFLDKKHQLIENYHHNEGSIDNVQVDIEKIAKKAIMLTASSVILTHNHPTGEVNPSKNDILTTEKILKTLNILNIKVFDHLILGPQNQYYSFKENGLL